MTCGTSFKNKNDLIYAKSNILIGRGTLVIGGPCSSKVQSIKAQGLFGFENIIDFELL